MEIKGVNEYTNEQPPISPSTVDDTLSCLPNHPRTFSVTLAQKTVVSVYSYLCHPPLAIVTITYLLKDGYIGL